MKNDDLKPIETVYNGYKFRSRLEARWAYFFDDFGESYEYEKEGFELEDGLRYLPDFYLPDFDSFFEIKGTEPNEIEIKKAALLSIVSKKPVFIIIGTPGFHYDDGLLLYIADYKITGFFPPEFIIQNGNFRYEENDNLPIYKTEKLKIGEMACGDWAISSKYDSLKSLQSDGALKDLPLLSIDRATSVSDWKKLVDYYNAYQIEIGTNRKEYYANQVNGLVFSGDINLFITDSCINEVREISDTMKIALLKARQSRFEFNA